jgi:AbrB family looped-hinge helix DNA binding protein
MSNFATITSKGTVSVPAAIRKQLGVKPGMRVQFRMNERTGNAEIVRPVDIEDLRRRTREHLQKHNIKPLSDEELYQAINDSSTEAAVERYRQTLE